MAEVYGRIVNFSSELTDDQWSDELAFTFFELKDHTTASSTVKDDIHFAEKGCSEEKGSILEEPFCTAVWDSFYCWPATPGGSNVSRPCSLIFGSHNVRIDGLQSETDAEAYRICTAEGVWLGNWTNYNQCVDLLPDGQDMAVGHLTVSYIMFICSFISLLTLCVTLGIFCYFKSLQCSRLRVHRNLVVSLIIHSILLIIIPSTVIFSSTLPTYTDVDWLCKLLLGVKMYAAMASINWMFVEGLLLHSRITVSIFKQDAPFKLYYLIGWGFPLVFVCTWASLMSRDLHTHCWKGYGKSEYVWILTGPMLIALLANSVFLVNIVRILITKLNRSGSINNRHMKQDDHSSTRLSVVSNPNRDPMRINWKAVKATALLFPLLGLTHLMFCINPKDDALFEEAYMITNAILQSSQGFFVSLLYCFMNSEVQTVVRNSYLRALIRRNPNHRYARNRSLPGTSTAFLSHTEVSVTETARHKVAPTKNSFLPLHQEVNGKRKLERGPEEDRNCVF